MPSLAVSVATMIRTGCMGWLLEVALDAFSQVFIHAAVQQFQATTLAEIVFLQQVFQPALGVAVLGEDDEVFLIPLPVRLAHPVEEVDQSPCLGVAVEPVFEHPRLELVQQLLLDTARLSGGDSCSLRRGVFCLVQRLVL